MGQRRQVMTHEENRQIMTKWQSWRGDSPETEKYEEQKNIKIN